MRKSVASLAVIARFERGQSFYLTHWNTGWNAFSLPGGHLHDDESHRACLVRELSETDELRLPPPPDDPDHAAAAPIDNLDARLVHAHVAAEPLGRMVYEAFSQSKKEPTRYTIDLFTAELSPGALNHIAGNPDLRWLSEWDIEAGRTDDGRPVSESVRRHLGWVARLAPVTWELAALKRTREVMAEELARAPDESCLVRECTFVAQQLRRMFPRARALVVRQRFEGFRPRLRPHKLLVEVTSDEGVLAPGVFGCREAHVVKVGRPLEEDHAGDLEDELRGWQRCKPGGSDTILSSLCGAPESGPLLGLVYSDAVTALGGFTRNLEAAVRACCRFGVPSLDSVLHCLRQLDDRLNLRLYGQSFDGPPALHLKADAPRDYPLRRRDEKADHSPTRLRFLLDRGLKRLREGKEAPAEGEERRRLRREALAILAVRENLAFLDPFDYLQGAIDGRHPVPFMLVGNSHGDLHGRNVQVGHLPEEVGAPAVFDYGDMHPANHVGWDFVKLETELKVRIYKHLFPRERPQFLKQVQAFEVRLAARTVALHHNSPSLEPPAETDERLERLVKVLLEVRRQARRCLGSDRHRLHRWLEEYFFLLACYGCNASSFPTYDDQEWLAVYCSAGTAARQLSLPWRSLALDIEEARKQAHDLLKALPAADPAGLAEAAGQLDTFSRPRLNHHARQEFARVWIEADMPAARPFVEAGLTLLGRLLRGLRRLGGQQTARPGRVARAARPDHGGRPAGRRGAAGAETQEARRGSAGDAGRRRRQHAARDHPPQRRPRDEFFGPGSGGTAILRDWGPFQALDSGAASAIIAAFTHPEPRPGVTP